MNFKKWLYSFPMPDGKPAKTIFPGLIALILIEAILITGCFVVQSVFAAAPCTGAKFTDHPNLAAECQHQLTVDPAPYPPPYYDPYPAPEMYYPPLPTRTPGVPPAHRY